MSAPHTEGRLVVGELTRAVLVDERGDLIASTLNGALAANIYGDARRLAACWNACEGLETHVIEAHQAVGFDALSKQWAEHSGVVAEELAAARALQAQLVEALKVSALALQGCTTGGYEDVDGDFVLTYRFDIAAVARASDVIDAALAAAGGAA